MEITLIPLLTDNYGYLLHDPSSKLTAVVDPSEAAPVLAAAKDHQDNVTVVKLERSA